jgi:hypothetical protein
MRTQRDLLMEIIKQKGGCNGIICGGVTYKTRRPKCPLMYSNCIKSSKHKKVKYSTQEECDKTMTTACTVYAKRYGAEDIVEALL